MATKSLGQLTIDVIAQVGGFVEGMSKAERSSAKWRKQVERNIDAAAKKFKWGAGIAAAASAYWVKTSLSAAAELENLSKVANTSTTEFQRFAAGARTVGLETDKVADILKDVNDRVGDFLQTGGGPMADFFEKVAPLVGVTADNFRDLSGAQALGLYVDTLQKAGLSQQEMTFYMEAMASDATALIPLLKDGAQEMKILGDRAEDLGTILSEDTIKASKQFEDDLDELGRVASTLGTQIGAQLLPELADLTKILRDPETMEAASEFAKAVVGAFTGIIHFSKEAVKFVEWSAESIAAALHGPAADDLVRIEERIETLTKKIESRKRAMEDRSGLSKWVDEQAGAQKLLVDGLAEWNAELEKLIAQRDFLNSIPIEPKLVDPPKEDGGSGSVGKPFDWGAHDEELEKFAELNEDKLAFQIEMNEKRLDEERRVAEQLDALNKEKVQQQIDDQKKLEEENRTFWENYLLAADEALTSLDDIAASTIESFSSGFGNAFEGIVFDFENLGDAFDQLMEGMARTTVNAVGKMVAEWLVYQAVQAATGDGAKKAAIQEITGEAAAGVALSAINAYKATAGIPVVGPGLAAGAAEAAVAYTGKYAAAATAAATAGFAGAFDQGGDIPSGMFGLVGEKGPELVNGPVHVTGREKTAAVFDRLAKDRDQMRAANDSQPPMNVRIINVKSEQEILEVLGSAAGEKVILNAGGRNPDFYRNLSNG